MSRESVKAMKDKVPRRESVPCSLALGAVMSTKGAGNDSVSKRQRLLSFLRTLPRAPLRSHPYAIDGLNSIPH